MSTCCEGMCRHADGGDRKEEEEVENKFHFTPQLLTLNFSFFLFIVLSSSANGATIYPAAQVSISEPLSTCLFCLWLFLSLCLSVWSAVWHLFSLLSPLSSSPSSPSFLHFFLLSSLPTLSPLFLWCYLLPLLQISEDRAKVYEFPDNVQNSPSHIQALL